MSEREFDVRVAEKVHGWRWWTDNRGYRFIRPPAWKPTDEYTDLGIRMCGVCPAGGAEPPFVDGARDVPHYGTSVADDFLTHRLACGWVKGQDLTYFTCLAIVILDHEDAKNWRGEFGQLALMQYYQVGDFSRAALMAVEPEG